MSKTYTIQQIAEIITPIMRSYGVQTAGLFGSYARGEATEDSDVDIVVHKGQADGLKFFGLWEDTEEKLGKHVDLIDFSGLYTNNDKLLNNIVRDEVRIYESS